jgi:hypothetical protein
LLREQAPLHDDVNILCLVIPEQVNVGVRRPNGCFLVMSVLGCSATVNSIAIRTLVLSSGFVAACRRIVYDIQPSEVIALSYLPTMVGAPKGASCG